MRLPDDHRDWLTPDGSGGFIYDPPLEVTVRQTTSLRSDPARRSFLAP
jgi:hypothetical protein